MDQQEQEQQIRARERRLVELLTRVRLYAVIDESTNTRMAGLEGDIDDALNNRPERRAVKQRRHAEVHIRRVLDHFRTGPDDQAERHELEAQAQREGVCPLCKYPARDFARDSRGRLTWACINGCNP